MAGIDASWFFGGPDVDDFFADFLGFDFATPVVGAGFALPTTTAGTGAVQAPKAVVTILPTTVAGAGAVQAAAGLPVQLAHPDGDVSTTGWTTQVGGTSSLFATLDEVVPDDSNYITVTI